MDFDKKAINWDDEKRVDRAKVIAREIIKAVPIQDSFSALEFGCGTGLISFNLYDKFKSITLVDTSKGMIEVLNSKIKEFGMKNMSAFQMDINSGESLTEKYDIIYTSMVLHHILDVESTITNLYNLLNTAGYLCIIDLDKEDGSFHQDEKDFRGHNGFNQEELAALLKKIGFKSIGWDIIYRDSKATSSGKMSYSLFLMKGVK